MGGTTHDLLHRDLHFDNPLHRNLDNAVNDPVNGNLQRRIERFSFWLLARESQGSWSLSSVLSSTSTTGNMPSHLLVNNALHGDLRNSKVIIVSF